MSAEQLRQLREIQAHAEAHGTPSYYGNALRLCAETLAEVKPDELEHRAPKVIAILTNAAAELDRLEQESAQLRAGYLAIERAAWARPYSKLKQARAAAGLTDMASRRDLEEGRGGQPSE